VAKGIGKVLVDLRVLELEGVAFWGRVYAAVLARVIVSPVETLASDRFRAFATREADAALKTWEARFMQESEKESDETSRPRAPEPAG